jgi:hypothetical protein
MLEQKRLGNHGTGPARPEQASQGSDEMDEKDDQIAHHRILAGGKSQRIMGEITIRQPHVEFRDGDLMFVAKDEMARLSANGLSVSRTREGHIELGTEGLRLKITGNPSGGFGYVSPGMVPSLTREGVIGLA